MDRRGLVNLLTPVCAAESGTDQYFWNERHLQTCKPSTEMTGS
jgi:hypothetical protein